jgi:hypothetical protein
LNHFIQTVKQQNNITIIYFRAPAAAGGVEMSKSFQNLLTGEIKGDTSRLTVNREIQFTYSESHSIHSAPQMPTPQPNDEEDEDMDLTAPAVFSQSQESQPLTQVISVYHLKKLQS